MANERHGQCLCGAIRITVRDGGTELGACHCGSCRRWTGSAFVTMSVPAAKIEVRGAEHIRSYASSDWAARSFCDTCGTTLWYRLTTPPAAGGEHDYYLAAGLLDDLSGLRLAHEIFIDRKPDAFAFAGPTHQMTEAEFYASISQPDSPEE